MWVVMPVFYSCMYSKATILVTDTNFGVIFAQNFVNKII